MARVEPIGRVVCRQRYRYEAPRQGVLRPENRAVIELDDVPEYVDGLTGLDGFERIWVVFELHLNETWHAFVQPPHEGTARQGVFATRSPHRPTRIGLSCVRLLGIEGRRLEIAGHDLLDGTPVFDIKPYVPYADAFPDAAAGWLDEVPRRVFEVEFEPAAAERAGWIWEQAELDCVNFARVQLSHDPTDAQRKRIEAVDEGYVIAYRTWRLDYRVETESRRVTVCNIRSGYEEADLAEGAADPHGDKVAHREFRGQFHR
jgi:tRNA-Thr(GGU) m(6)t(6)A37 methyltransferase TsaA